MRRIIQLQRRPNGSKRIWVAFSLDSGAVTGVYQGYPSEFLGYVYDDGYRTRTRRTTKGYPSELLGPLHNHVQIPTVDVTAADYNSTVRFAKDQGIWFPS